MATDRNALTWTSAQVLTDVRRKASLPLTSTDWTDAVVLREATDVLRDFAGWALAQAGEGRQLASLNRSITTALTGVYGARELMLPPLASAGSIEGITWTDASGQTQSRLSRIDDAQEAEYSRPGDTGSPGAYALYGDRIRLYPAPTTGGILRVTYQRMHPELVVDSVVSVATLASVASASDTTSTLTLSAGFSPQVSVGDTLDIVRNQYPYAPIAESIEVTAVGGALSLTVDQPVALLSGHETAGARVVRAGNSPYVSLPLELRNAFNEKVAANILRTMGDLQGSAAAEQSATMQLARVMQMLSPRAKRDKPKAINPHSHLRSAFRRWGW